MELSFAELRASWETFHVIVGSVAGALIGLQFVVIALVADSRQRATSPEIAAFGTPNVLHFSAALLLSALLTVPWTSGAGLQLALIACGVAGIGYVGIIFRRARSTRAYRPQLEDWIWHVVLPLVAYLALAVAGLMLARHPAGTLGILAAVTLGLVFIGIHNAWDTVTYVATGAGR